VIETAIDKIFIHSHFICPDNRDRVGTLFAIRRVPTCHSNARAIDISNDMFRQQSLSKSRIKSKYEHSRIVTNARECIAILRKKVATAECGYAEGSR
jgi:hypothetical protein